MRSNTWASVDAALYATTRIPIRFIGQKATEPLRLGRWARLTDPFVRLVGDRRRVLVDVVDARFALALGRVLDGRRGTSPLDGLHLVVHRAVGAVHGELVAHERAAALLPQREVRGVALVAALVDQAPTGPAPERQHDLLVVLVDVDAAHVADHRPGDDLGAHRRRQRAPVRARVASGAHELVTGLAQRLLDCFLPQLLADEREQRRDPVDR